MGYTKTPMSVSNFNIVHAVHQHSLTHPDRLAVAAAGKELSYAQLAKGARNIAACVRQSAAWARQPNGQPARIGVLASRSLDACLAVLGAAWSGASYVPISLKLPEERLLMVLSLCNLSALITDKEGAKLLTDPVLAACPPLIVLPGAEPFQALDRHGIAFHDIDHLPDDGPRAPENVDAGDTAYIIFTSGSTGVPKGVSISAASIRYFSEMMPSQLNLRVSDRVLETCELSFDVSAHNMFSTWHAGASLHILPAVRVMSAVKFCQDNALTVWNSVPSLIGRLMKIKATKPNVLPSLRLTVLSGEPLPKSYAAQWQVAAPNSAIENFYGPTEATIFTLHQAVSTPYPVTPGRDFISIGKPLPGTQAAIVDSEGTFVPPGTVGELALTGVQLSTGYLNAPELTQARFPMIQGKTYYLTGDLAMQDTAGIFHCLGRIDNQVKIRGHRVELEEIDAYLREATQASLVTTVAWPLVDGNAQGIVSFIEAKSVDQQTVITELKSKLPAYMVTDRVVALERLPLNPSGKIDRKALLQFLDNEKPA